MPNIKVSLFIALIFCFKVYSAELKKIEAEYVLSINGEKSRISTSQQRKVSIEGKVYDVEITLADYKFFDNYGLRFKLPVKASGYLDESNDEVDIWNFDYHDTFIMLAILKNSDAELNEAFLASQLQKTSKLVGFSLGKMFPAKYENFKGVAAFASIGEAEFLIEQYGFSNSDFKFLAYVYSPKIDRKHLDSNNVNWNFKRTVFNSAEY